MRWLSDRNRVRVDKNGVKMFEKYATVNASSSRENRNWQEGDSRYFYSNWGFMRFVSKAFEKAKEHGLKEGDLIILKSAYETNEPYDKDGVRVWQNLQTIVLDFEYYVAKSNTKPEKEDEDSFPWEKE